MPIIAEGDNIIFVSESWDTPDKRAAASYSRANIQGIWEVDPDDNSSIQFRIPKEKFGGSHDRIGMYFSGSGKIGIGTKNPETAFDVRDMAEDKSDKETDSAGNRRENLLKLDRTADKIDTKATSLRTARTIGGVSFDGSANINLPGVNIAGNQNTSGKAATATLADDATKLKTARTIGGVSFDGSANIVPRQYKGSTTKLYFLGTDFTSQGVAEKAGGTVYLKPNILVSPTSVQASAAGTYFYNVTLPIGLSPAGIVVYGDDAKGCKYKVYASLIPNAKYGDQKTKYTQIDGSGLSGIAIGTAISANSLAESMKKVSIDWDSSEYTLTIAVTTDGTDTIYGGQINMA
jgi:hypothetical protein